MTTCRRGDVVLVGFVFADESGKKLRPALVVSSAAYHHTRQEAIVAAITSNIGRPLVGDHVVGDWRRAGLLFPSLVTGIVRTVKRSMIERRLGRLDAADLTAVGQALRRSLAL
jgi:mRNA interferase MazF